MCDWPRTECRCGRNHVKTHPDAGCADVACNYPHDDIDHERDALQKAYNGLCGVEGRLLEAGWQDSAIAADVAAVRKALAKVAFDA